MVRLIQGGLFGKFGPENLVGDYLNVMRFADDVTLMKGGGHADLADPDSDGTYRLVGFTGLRHPPDGTVRELIFSKVWGDGDRDGGEVTRAIGFDLRIGDIRSAITAAKQGDSSELKALFDGVGWHFTESQTGPHAVNPIVAVFGGTGGDDEVRLGRGNDELQLDGGNDKFHLGAGDDTINLDNLFRYQALGLSQINAGSGHDLLDLHDLDSEEVHHGLTINLNKTINLGPFDIHVKNVEEVIGTDLADNITGTSGDDVLNGFLGGGTMTGGNGADELIGSPDAQDIFVYHQASNSSAGDGRDTIDDFEHGVDIIDLSLIDPGTKNHKFHFVGDGPLEHEGDICVIHHHGDGQGYDLIEANLDNDKGVEFEIKVKADVDLTQADFLL